MNRYVNLILISMLLFVLSPVAWANSVFQQLGEVTNVSPIHGHQQVMQRLPQKVEVCYRRDSNGFLEEITDRGFGSTRGLIGTAIGVAIGDEIGGGKGNDAAKIIGGLIGNKIGNNYDHRAKADECRIEERYSQHPTLVQSVLGYGISVRLEDGTVVNVTRDYEPELGEMITVNTRVW
jgi:uncharacterized protein YcfJ